MCKWGTCVEMEFEVPAWASHTGKARMKMTKIDSCIVPIIKALNAADIKTVGSCCSHGNSNGSIHLEDGRKLVIIYHNKLPEEFSCVQDKPECKCMDCGLDYSEFGVDFTFPHEEWTQINPEENGILCANCMIIRASKLPGIIAVRGYMEFANKYENN